VYARIGDALAWFSVAALAATVGLSIAGRTIIATMK